MQAMDADGVVARSFRRFIGHLGFGNDVAARRLPARELDPCRPADQAAPLAAPQARIIVADLLP